MDVVGQIFIASLRLVIVPLVFFSLVCGVVSISSTSRIGTISLKTLSLYLLTTAIAISVALTFALIFKPGIGIDLALPTAFESTAAPSIKEVLINIFPTNPVAAMAEGNMLQIIVFSLLFGIALKSLETGGGNGMCIHTTSGQWDLYTRAGNQSGLNIGHSNVASSGHSRMYITEAGQTCVGTHVYDNLTTARKAHTIFHVAGGGLSIGPHGNTSSTKQGGRYVLGWYMATPETSYSYIHLGISKWE